MINQKILDMITQITTEKSLRKQIFQVKGFKQEKKRYKELTIRNTNPNTSKTMKICKATPKLNWA